VFNHFPKILLGDFISKFENADLWNRKLTMKFYMEIANLRVLEWLVLPHQKI
jgi:hypothetical protein